MTRTSSFALCAALLLTVASAAALTESLAPSAFAAAPGKVFDGTPSTGVDKATWGTYTAAAFGPGSTNSTVFAYGWTLATATTITAVASRTLNATLLSNGTADTTEYAIIGTDASYTTTITIQSGSAQTAVGLGTFAIAYAATDTTGCSQVYVAIFTGGTAAPSTKAITSNTCSHCTNAAVSTGVGYANLVNNVFYENSTFYVSYTTTVYTEKAVAGTASGCTSSTTFPSAVATSSGSQPEIDAQVMSYLQGVSTSGTLKWTAAATIYTGTASTAGAAPSPLASAIMAMCGQGNYTNSTNLLCAYTVSTTVSYIPVVVSTGVAGTAVTIATSTAISGTTYPQTIYTYTVAGFVHSQYQQGILLNNLATSYSAALTVSGTVNTLQFYNLTSGATSTTGATAGGIAFSPSITNTYASGQYSGMGGANVNGFGIVDTYATASGAYATEYSTWLANGTANVTKATIASGAVSASPSVFVDANGALWAGAYSLDTTATPNTLSTGYLGKVSAQIYPLSSSMARVVVTCFFFGLISLVALLVI